MKIISWNINGIASWAKANETLEFLEKENPDIFCMQETKTSVEKVTSNNSKNIQEEESKNHILKNFPKESAENINKILEKYPFQYFHFAEKKGYSGTAIFSKLKPASFHFGLEDEDGQNIDKEGRVVVLKFEKFSILNVYTPNSRIDFSRIDYRTNTWDKNFEKYLEKLKKEKPLIICGDMNVLASDIDLRNYNFYFKNEDFREKILKERKSFEKFLALGFKDIYRKFFPEKIVFSWVSPAALQIPSTRLDYFLVDDKLEEKVLGSDVLDDYALAKSSDHFPIVLEIEESIWKGEEGRGERRDRERIIFPEIEQKEDIQMGLF